MIKTILKILCAILLLCILVFGCDMVGIIGSPETVTVSIGEQDNLTTISKKLEGNGVVLNQYIFKFYYQLTNPNATIYPGTISVRKNSSYHDIMKAISNPATNTISITIPEGFEVREITARLLQNGLIQSEEEFQSALRSFTFQTNQGTFITGEALLEGYLFPDTYQVKNNASPEDIIRLMTSNFQSKWTDQYEEQAKKMGMDIREVITMASIVEREARKTEDFPLVASVFHNRLKLGKRLESCATVQYILKERKPVLSVADTKIDSPYNTYQNDGLPPAPISSPGILAIEAVLYPKETDYLYFFTDKNGDNHYSKSYEEHNQQINQYGL